MEHPLQSYLVRRMLLLIPTLFVVSVVAFGIVRLMPGDVVLRQLSESPSFKQEDADALRAQLGLDEPVVKQYGKWVAGAVHGDLGRSLWSDKPVRDLLWERFIPTAELALIAFLMANSIAIVLGVVSAARQDSLLDQVLRLLSIGGLSLPNFWIGTMLIVFGAKWFGYLPPLTYVSLVEDPGRNLQQFLVPAAVIAISASSVIMRMVRSSMLEVLRQDYIRTGLAKGLRERRVIFGHALKNAMLPVVTLMGFQLSLLLSGSVVIELLCGIPGTGRMMFDAVSNRDYTVVQGAILLFAVILVVINLFVDLTYAWLDPRVSYGGQ